MVDDNATNRRLLERLLTDWGMEPELVAGGREAVARLTSAAAAGRPFAVAILDMQMPELDGLDTARAIRGLPALDGVSLLMLTSWARRGLDAEARAAGIVDCLSKPVRTPRLLAALSAIATGAPGAGRGGVRNGANGHSVAPRQLGEITPSDRPRVLVAEDNVVNQRVITRMLEKRGYHADVVTSGFDALNAVTAGGYELVFMDCDMPGMDGFEATRRLRAREAAGCSRVPIIAVTADALAGDRERCLAAGMDDYLSKPFSAAALADVLARWGGGHANAGRKAGPG